MVLHQYSFENTPNKTVKKIAAILNQRESEWSKEQQILHRLKIEEKIKKAKNLSQYTNKLLLQCKSWKGPVISIYELTGILNAKPDMGEQIVRRELSYYRNTHKSDVIASPTLFKLNKITHEERLTNLCVLLGGMNNRSFIVLPRNEDALTALKDCNAKQDDDSLILEINQICVTLQTGEYGKIWYIGYCKEVKDNKEFIIEHLRVDLDSNLKWKYPTSNDICVVEADQILQCEIDGEWDVINDRNMTFTLHNHEHINMKFLEVK